MKKKIAYIPKYKEGGTKKETKPSTSQWIGPSGFVGGVKQVQTPKSVSAAGVTTNKNKTVQAELDKEAYYEEPYKSKNQIASEVLSNIEESKNQGWREPQGGGLVSIDPVGDAANPLLTIEGMLQIPQDIREGNYLSAGMNILEAVPFINIGFEAAKPLVKTLLSKVGNKDQLKTIIDLIKTKNAEGIKLTPDEKQVLQSVANVGSAVNTTVPGISEETLAMLHLLKKEAPFITDEQFKLLTDFDKSEIDDRISFISNELKTQVSAPKPKPSSIEETNVHYIPYTDAPYTEFMNSARNRRPRSSRLTNERIREIEESMIQRGIDIQRSEDFFSNQNSFLDPYLFFQPDPVPDQTVLGKLIEKISGVKETPVPSSADAPSLVQYVAAEPGRGHISTIKKALSTIKDAPKGSTFMPSRSLSSDSYNRLTLPLIEKGLKDNIIELNYHGYNSLNPMGFATKAGVSNDLIIKEINSSIDKINKITGKKYPYAVVKNDKIFYPNFSVTRKKLGGLVKAQNLGGFDPTKVNLFNPPKQYYPASDRTNVPARKLSVEEEAQLKKEAAEARARKEYFRQQELKRRKDAIDSSIEARDKELSAENFATETGAIGEKLRFFPNDPNSFIDEYINPFKMVGDMASGLGQIPLNLQQGNYGQAALNLAVPVATGLLGGIGAKTTGQFVNNLVNPFAGMGIGKRFPHITNSKLGVKQLSDSGNSDELVDLWRVEPADWDKITHPTGPNDPMLQEHIDVFYPYDTYGKWFEQDLNKIVKGRQTVAPGLLSRGYNSSPTSLNLFNIRVPKSELFKYKVKGTPFEGWSKSPDSEYLITFDRNTTPKITFTDNNEGWQSISKDLFQNLHSSDKSTKSAIKIDPTKLEDAKGFLKRRQFIKGLQKEGLIGKDFNLGDVNYAARSTDKTNKLTQFALNREATRFRGVTGSVPKDGKGIQEYTRTPWDMSRPSIYNEISEFENMKNAGVDFNDPLSIAKYQASHVPMEQYGYISGLPANRYLGGLYLSSAPNNYGNYQIRMTSPRDYSTGNYQDWFNKYFAPENNFDDLSKGFRRFDFNPVLSYERPMAMYKGSTNVMGKRGSKMFDVDESFPFMDYKSLTPEQNLEFKKYIDDLLQDYKTGWRGKYKNGGMIKRKDGSYSRRGLWDNIRDNAGSGKKPTAEMLKQERKIRNEEKEYGGSLPTYDVGSQVLAKAKELSQTEKFRSRNYEGKNCSAATGECYTDAGLLIPTRTAPFKIAGTEYKGGMPLPIIPSTREFEKYAEPLGFKKVEGEYQPGDRIHVVDDKNNPYHSMIYAGKNEKGEDQYYSDSGEGTDFKLIKWPGANVRGYRYVGDENSDNVTSNQESPSDKPAGNQSPKTKPTLQNPVITPQVTNAPVIPGVTGPPIIPGDNSLLSFISGKSQQNIKSNKKGSKSFFSDNTIVIDKNPQGKLDTTYSRTINNPRGMMQFYSDNQGSQIMTTNKSGKTSFRVPTEAERQAYILGIAGETPYPEVKETGGFFPTSTLGVPYQDKEYMYQEGGNTDYNLNRAKELGYTADEAGHLPSVDYTTGMWLKSKKHPTAFLEYLEAILNPELQNQQVIVNPEGYFGNEQLQYVPKKQTGGNIYDKETDNLINSVTQMLSQGEDPEAIGSALVDNGYDHEIANAIVEEALATLEDYGDYEEEDINDFDDLNVLRNGGIPDRYKNQGFTRVGAKRKSNRPGKKWMVLAKKGNKYKIVHGGYKGMKDYTQHGSEERRERFWDRMGGKNSSKAKDPFSPLYWHKRFGTWQDGGKTPIEDPEGQRKYPGKTTRIPSNRITMEGINYPVLAIGDNGKANLMLPGEEYLYLGVNFIDEVPFSR